MKYRVKEKIKSKSGRKQLNLKSLMWIIILFFLILKVFFTIKTASLGAKLANIESKTHVVAERNQDLTYELVNSSSLSRVQDRAGELGFIKPGRIVYIESENPVAKVQ